MSVEDKVLSHDDRAYGKARTPVEIVDRTVTVGYKKSYGGMSPYFAGIQQGADSVLRYTICENGDGHDVSGSTLRFQVPRADCPECWGKTKWQDLPNDARFYVDALSTAVELAGISFMDQLPVTVAWLKAKLPDGTELDTLASGMVSVDDFHRLQRGSELRPVFREKPQGNASDVMWILKGTLVDQLPKGYVTSKNYDL